MSTLLAFTNFHAQTFTNRNIMKDLTSIEHTLLIGFLTMTVDPWPKAVCVICKERRAKPMTFVCEDEKCLQHFMDIQFKGKLKELFGISDD